WHKRYACFLAYDIGGCWNYTMMWFYDSNEGRCSRFWYGGCGGNANRFRTEEECKKLCLSPRRSHLTRTHQ
uniref:BPTI/Kunitz inhibitor domain-containing protein n=1 Tax=Anabas testudineus TaxID=64144 RepID=A0A3Q1J9C6_ANATE